MTVPSYLHANIAMRFFLLFLLTGLLSCGPQVSSEAELEAKLIKAMENHLKANARPGVQFTVKEAIWAEKTKEYFCEFKVRMQDGIQDTTGTMTALISKDFSSVERSQ